MAKSKNKLQDKKQNKVHLEVENLKTMLARALADYDNLNKRTERERQALNKIASVGVLIKLLPVLDNLEAAQAHLHDSGLAISIEEFKKVLGEENLTEISPKVGEEFDENTMEVVEVTKGERDNIISEVLLTGWKFDDLPTQEGGRIVRHAKVKVSKNE